MHRSLKSWSICKIDWSCRSQARPDNNHPKYARTTRKADSGVRHPHTRNVTRTVFCTIHPITPLSDSRQAYQPSQTMFPEQIPLNDEPSVDPLLLKTVGLRCINSFPTNPKFCFIDKLTPGLEVCHHYDIHHKSLPTVSKVLSQQLSSISSLESTLPRPLPPPPPLSSGLFALYTTM